MSFRPASRVALIAVITLENAWSILLAVAVSASASVTMHSFPRRMADSASSGIAEFLSGFLLMESSFRCNLGLELYLSLYVFCSEKPLGVVDGGGGIPARFLPGPARYADCIGSG